MFLTTCKNLAALLALSAAAAGTGATQGEKPKPPRPVERDGLAVTIKAARPVFAPGEALAFEVTFKNITDVPIRFPGRPQAYFDWHFHVEKFGSETLYKGGSVLPAGREVKAAFSQPLGPGDSLSVNVKLGDSFGFSEKTWDPSKAAKQLPEGKYRLRAEIRFPNLPRPDKNPTRVWDGAPLITRTAEFVISGEPKP